VVRPAAAIARALAAAIQIIAPRSAVRRTRIVVAQLQTCLHSGLMVVNPNPGHSAHRGQ